MYRDIWQTSSDIHRRDVPWCVSTFVLWCVMISFFAPLSAQENDTTQQQRLQEVIIAAEQPVRIAADAATVQQLTAKQLKMLPSLQLSDALKYMSGVVVKDYGGTGGMKTVSVRGLGSQHTGVIYDGIPLTDCQTGQIDLGKLSLDNVRSIVLEIGMSSGIFVPARLFSYSNILKINTLSRIPNKPFGVKVGFTAGSYGLYSPQIFLENLLKSRKREDRFFVWNVSASFLTSKGNYPFVLHYGGITDSVSHERRQNSDVSVWNAEANMRFQINRKQHLTFKWYYYDSERGLPSATTFYNLNSSQRLWNRNTFGQLSYCNFFNTHWAYQLNAKFNYDHTHYLDTTYNNTAGRLENDYRQTESYLSNTVMYTLPFTDKKGRDQWLQIALSHDVFHNFLKSNALNYDDPSRITSLAALSLLYKGRMVKVHGNLLFTAVHDWAQGTVGDNFFHLSPTVGVAVAATKSLSFRAFYKNIFRMPTFNDLYYREVGNLNLNPEKTRQWDVGAVYNRDNLAHGRVALAASVDGYFNIVKDKIVAFPAGNLFSWTMMNYGKVFIGGAEVNANVQYQFAKGFFLRVNGNCTYQKAVDRTNPTDKTYNHQIPYTPVWSGSTGVSVELPWITFSYSLLLAGERYALGQNIPINRVAGYADHSVTIGHQYKIKNTPNTIGFKCEFLNLANKNYEIIRNYPMQGFGFRVKVFYEY
ncbi:MAG: TonB-dependent receptor [Bacteroidales bacterium]|nr:TonB-dependent receptor [Bacteroidales bacterium]